MSFEPFVPVSGYAGWQFLQRTLDKQTEAFERSPQLQREVEYFRENIKNVTSAEELVGDLRLARVVLGAYSLGDEIDKRAIIRRALEDDPEDKNSLVNKLVDSRYIEFAKDLSFHGKPVDFNDEFVSRIIEQYTDEQFEISLGASDGNARLSLNFDRSIVGTLNASASDKRNWLEIIGSEPLKRVLTTAFNLPAQFNSLDIDRQVELIEEKALSLYGDKSPLIFLELETKQDVIRRFNVLQDVQGGFDSTTPGAAALTILQSSGLGAGGASNLALSSLL